MGDMTQEEQGMEQEPQKRKPGRPRRAVRPEVLATPQVTLDGVDETIEQWQQWAASQPTAFGRLLAARWLIERLRRWASIENGIGQDRTAAARELNMAGWSLREISETSGVSIARVQQWLQGGG